MAAIHAGKDADDSGAAGKVWVDFAKGRVDSFRDRLGIGP